MNDRNHPTPRYFRELADDLCRDLTAALATGETGPDVDELIEAAAKARVFATEDRAVRS